MIYEISREVETALRARGCPLPVEYDPGRPSMVAIPGARGAIVFSRDRDQGDTWGPLRGVHRGTGTYGVASRLMACVVRIHVQSTKAGARPHEHERLADAVADLVAVALADVGKTRRGQLEFTAGKMLSAADLALIGAEGWAGAVYEIRFTAERAVTAKTWEGADVLDTVTIGPAPDVSILTAHPPTVS